MILVHFLEDKQEFTDWYSLADYIKQRELKNMTTCIKAWKYTQSAADKLLTHFEKKHGWWMETKAIMPCGVCNDGQIVKLHLALAKDLMDNHYPFIDRSTGRIWYFNKSRDREIAEQDGDFIYANPRVLWDHLMPKQEIVNGKVSS